MSYQRRSPDYTALVVDVARRFPVEWEAARERPDGHRDDRFIRLLAWELHKVDANVGLNGKRGSDVISTDAVSYRNPTGPGGVEVIDVIVGATHTPTWQDVTIPPSPDRPDGVPGKYIEPAAPGAPAAAGSSPGVPAASSPGTAAFTLTADLSALLGPLHQEVRRLEALIEEQRVQIEGLRARLAAADTGDQPARVALKSVHGTYLTAESDGRACCRENQPAAWQTFELERVRS